MHYEHVYSPEGRGRQTGRQTIYCSGTSVESRNYKVAELIAEGVRIEWPRE